MENQKRKIIVSVITGISYIATLRKIFINYEIISSVIFVMIFFICFHFLFLEFKTIKKKHIALILLGLSILTGLIFGHFNPQLILGILFFHIAIFFMSQSLKAESEYTTKFDGTGYFMVGGYIFTALITIMYSFTLLGLYTKFPFTCEQISQASARLVDNISKPFKIGFQEAEGIKDQTKTALNFTFQEVFHIGNEIEIKAKTQNEKTISITEKFKAWKKTYIEQPLQDNKFVNMGICDYVLTSIHQVFNKPGFQISAVLLMFLMLYGFIRLAFWISSAIGFLIFQFLYLSKVYTKKKILKEVEVIG